MFKNCKRAVERKALAVKAKLGELKANFFTEHAVAIIIVMVVGMLVMGLIYALWNTTIMESIKDKVTEMFTYAG